MNVKDLIPASYNPRKDLQPSDGEYQKIKKSILEFDYVDPLIFNIQTKTIVSGNQRLKVLKELGYEQIEVNCVNLDQVKEKMLNVALNKVQGDWDEDKLKELLNEFVAFENFDFEVVGFSDFETNDFFKQNEFDSIIDELENNAFSNTINNLLDTFNITFSFPTDKKEHILGKIKENTKEFLYK